MIIPVSQGANRGSFSVNLVAVCSCVLPAWMGGFSSAFIQNYKCQALTISFSQSLMHDTDFVSRVWVILAGGGSAL